MKNLEKWEKEILTLLSKTDSNFSAGIAVEKGVPILCKTINCETCDFNKDDGSCETALIKWFYSEYVPPKKLNYQQRMFCELVKTGWLARGANGILRLYKNKPKKIGNVWAEVFDATAAWWTGSTIVDFDFIKWTDQEPYSIEQMLTWDYQNDTIKNFVDAAAAHLMQHLTGYNDFDDGIEMAISALKKFGKEYNG